MSHYKVFKFLGLLKRTSTIEKGTLRTVVVDEKVLMVVRELGDSVAVLLVNFADTWVTFNAKAQVRIPDHLITYVPSVHSKLVQGSLVDMTRVTMPASASVVLITFDLIPSIFD